VCEVGKGTRVSQKEALNMKLRLSEDYVIDTDDYRREGLRVAILALSGHGKSNAAAEVIEDVLDQNWGSLPVL
jgi:hypothetical protein